MQLEGKLAHGVISSSIFFFKLFSVTSIRKRKSSYCYSNSSSSVVNTPLCVMRDVDKILVQLNCYFLRCVLSLSTGGFRENKINIAQRLPAETYCFLEF